MTPPVRIEVQHRDRDDGTYEVTATAIDANGKTIVERILEAPRDLFPEIERSMRDVPAGTTDPAAWIEECARRFVAASPKVFDVTNRRRAE